METDPFNLANEVMEKELEVSSSRCIKNTKFGFIDLLSSASRSSACMLGIDEAGRGPVLGPMVYACALAPIERLEELRSIGLADSKTLTEQQRKNLLQKMLQKADWIAGCVHVISPVYITEKMLDRCKTNLNTISHDAAIGLIQTALDHGVNLSEVYVDTVGKAELYEAKLQNLFPMLKICVESKADDTYPIVSAASIFAKVTRDRLLQMWPKNERGYRSRDQSIGSGYPGDPITKKYLLTCLDPVFGFPSIVRSSWSTALILMEKHCVPVTWEDDECAKDTNELKKLNRKRQDAKGTNPLLDFFQSQSKPTQSNALNRQPFYTLTGLKHVQQLI